MENVKFQNKDNNQLLIFQVLKQNENKAELQSGILTKM